MVSATTIRSSSSGLVRSTLVFSGQARTVSVSRPLASTRARVWVLPVSEVGAPSLRRLLTTLLVIGSSSFGGGMGAYLREYLVNRLRFLDEEEYLAALEISQTLPGLNSVNLAVIVGDRFGGLRGALAAPLALCLPGILFVLMLGQLHSHMAGGSSMEGLIRAGAAAAVGLPIAMTLQMAQKHLEDSFDVVLALLAFVAMAWLKLSLLTVLLALGPLSVWHHRPGRDRNEQ